MSSLDGFGPLGLPRARSLGEQRIGELGLGAQDALEAAPSGEASFGNVLEGMLDEVVARKQEVTDKVEALASGEPVELHDVMIAMGKSEVAFNLMLEVRNKLVDAWRELGRSVV